MRSAMALMPIQPGLQRQRVRGVFIRSPAASRMRCTVTGMTRSVQAAIESSRSGPRQSVIGGAEMREPGTRDHLRAARREAMRVRRALQVLTAPQRNTMRTIATSCGPRSMITFSTRTAPERFAPGGAGARIGPQAGSARQA